MDYVERFLRALSAEGLASSTIGHYSLWLSRWGHYCRQAGTSIAEPDIDAAEEWVATLRRQHGPENVRKAVTCVRSFYNWMVARRHGRVNPFAGMRHRGMRPVRLPKGVPTEEEVMAMLRVFDRPQKMADLRDRAIVHVLYGSALRRGELIGLNLDDVNWDQRQLFLRETKTRQQAIVPIHADGLQALRDYVDLVRPEYARRAGARAEKMAVAQGREVADAWLRDVQRALFLGPRGGRITGDLVAAAVSRAASRAGIQRHIHPHLLRHAPLTHMRSKGADLRVIQEFARHRSIQATQLYLHLSKRDLTEAYERFHPAAMGAGN